MRCATTFPWYPEAASGLFIVDEAEIAQVLALPVPAHPETTFDHAQFLDVVAGAFSITLEEKRGLVADCGSFSQYQIDELILILLRERWRFAELNARYLQRMKDLDAKHGTNRVVPFRPPTL